MVKEAFIGRYDIRETLERYGLTGRKLYIAGEDAHIDGAWQVTFHETIMYRAMFPWLQEINKDSVLVLNQCLRNTKPNLLDYNCIRHYCQQCGNILVFNRLPLLQSIKDFNILRSFIAPNPFMKQFDNDYSHIHANFHITYRMEKAERAITCDTGIIPRHLLRLADKYKPKGFDRLDDFKPEMNVCVADTKADRYFYQELLRKKKEAESLYDHLSSRD